MSRQRREQRVLDAGEGRGRTLPCLQALILQMFSPAEVRQVWEGGHKHPWPSQGLPGGTGLFPSCRVPRGLPCTMPLSHQDAAAGGAGSCYRCRETPVPQLLPPTSFPNVSGDACPAQTSHVCHQRSTPRGRAASPSLPCRGRKKSLDGDGLCRVIP